MSPPLERCPRCIEDRHGIPDGYVMRWRTEAQVMRAIRDAGEERARDLAAARRKPAA